MDLAKPSIFVSEKFDRVTVKYSEVVVENGIITFKDWENSLPSHAQVIPVRHFKTYSIFL